MKILADNSLPLLHIFTLHFEVVTYKDENELKSLLKNDFDILLCRSTLKVNEALLFNTTIQCVATASSGIDHIDCNYLQKKNINLFHAHGCNAIAVADYVIATVASLTKNNLLSGKKAGIVGLGAVGTQVEKRLARAGFTIECFDPLKAKATRTKKFCDMEALYSCDLLCIHANLHETWPFPSKNLINADFIRHLKEKVVIINASRGGVVVEKDLLNQSSKSLIYCTDVYSNEPSINEEIIDFAYICTPHIAGHSIEAKKNAVLKLSEQIHACYSFTSPFFPNTTEITFLPIKKSWQEFILSIYNPVDETNRIKQAKNKKNCFMDLRNQHTTRHDFLYYNAQGLNQSIKSLLGQ
ncbi:erythronate-4-phosphate dehydrogenase (plasmid) [Legionella adelaidensis]|uniref:Erythronate-4-phosphate dehydrogenase n=1 Tax=Legionella adelaidensis TaxID=45056 RepID=A0A0W0R4U6_9GAMM|nr:NAD(P)-dependent oxidoreductase [Legionella adelaidensis]KTC66100.1 erythronate-4-phosphate dehydrogenase [Legionella adelaidensis]VEH85830.1 erythronate-4-phosphate dehydrogenase [Legionella adelaidensis]